MAECDEMYEELEAAAKACEETAAEFDRDPLDALIKKARTAAQSLERSWSGSWAGYQARCYWEEFKPAEAPFSIEWGILGGSPYSPDTYAHRTSGWREYDKAAIYAQILKRAGVQNLDPLQEAAVRAADVLTENKREILTTLDALLATRPDSVLQETRDKVSTLKEHASAAEIARARCPAQVVTRDQRFQFEGVEVPPHIQFEAEILSSMSYAGQLHWLARFARTAALYLKKATILTKPEPVAMIQPDRLERPWDLWMIGVFGLGLLVGRFGERALDAVQRLTLIGVVGLPPIVRALAVALAIGAALVIAGVAGNLIASQIDRDEQGMLRVTLRRPWVRVLIFGAILLTAIAHALTQL